MAEYGATVGINTLDLSKPVYPRGIPLSGMARDIVREVALSAGGLWSIQQGQIHLTPKTLDNPNSTISLTASTGLIGWPKQTADGIYATSLLNPALQPLMKIQLDSSQIIQAERDNNPQSEAASKSNQILKDQNLASGTFTIFHMNRRGDTRGAEWFDDILCIGTGGIIPPDQQHQGYSLGNS